MAFKFYDLGPRGIVIHDPQQRDEARFTYALEADWRQRAIENPSGGLLQLAEGDRIPMALLSGGRVFVNLNSMVTLEKGKEAPGTVASKQGSESDAIILCEGRSFYSISPRPEPAIPEGFEQDAGVLVNRGAVVAAIPGGNLPIGTWCVLVNLAQVARS